MKNKDDWRQFYKVISGWKGEFTIVDLPHALSEKGRKKYGEFETRTQAETFCKNLHFTKIFEKIVLKKAKAQRP